MMHQINPNYPFIVRVQGKRTGHPDNVRHFNCDSLTTLDFQLKKARADTNAHKVEVLAVLEVWQRD